MLFARSQGRTVRAEADTVHDWQRWNEWKSQGCKTARHAKFKEESVQIPTDSA